ncbi:acetoacetate decarboxylase [Spirosoma sp. KCTC 42546]|uniref:acetoacetate decarboxylase family protein n=1 Tax=Spirosoma sp. KCTC 42546 TaxID=2520506 RepID=UPI001159B78A|nr:acetoacetate decarboxylase family protein [Spirosoma sp. KCTC 42546]QDK78532.1 acetoacetate decarboxylase [Spirosoma sp. KCTC 42546]
MAVPKRIRDYEGRYSFVDGIPFKLPVSATDSPALMAAFPCNYDAALKLMPGNELFPVRLPNGKAVFIVTIINYVHTTIGKYIEYSLAVACTHGPKPAPRLLPALFQKFFKTGQFILDLPVSTEISVKGGKGIWGMPKHKANLDFIVTDTVVSSQYEKDGQFAFRIEMDRPKRASIHLNIGSINYSHFRNMLMASYIYFDSKAGINLMSKAQARLYLGDHPKVARLHTLNIEPKALFTAFLPSSHGVLDDHFECWFVTYKTPETDTSEGLSSVFGLENKEEWLPAPSITDFQRYKL